MSNTHPNEPQRKSDQPKNGSAPASTAPREMPKEQREYLAETYGYTPQQVNVLRNAICVGATDAELEFFLATCKRVALDPFARQIWFVKRRQKIEDSNGTESWVDVGRPETSIDGFRTIAERSGEYEGQAPIEWCDKSGKWFDVWLKEEPPFAARARVHREKHREPMVAVALFTEYCPVYKNGGKPAMWRKMPANQLGVRAEAQALRKAFPRDLSGLITDGEGEAMEIAAGYSVPAKAPAKSAPVQTAPHDEPAQLAEKSEHTENAGELQRVIDETLVNASDVERECVAMMKEIVAARSKIELQPVGLRVSAAKKQLAANAGDQRAKMILDTVEPELQKRWREVPKDTPK